MVSVIVPVYNVSPYIERCIHSVMAQSYVDIECIFVDDATEDDSIVKCERLVGDYEGPICFKIIYNKQNRGLSAARNTGIENATGEWIFFLDSDDEITPNCIEKLLKAANGHPDAEMVIGNSQKYYINGKTETGFYEDLPDTIRKNEDVTMYFHRQQIPFAAWNKLIKTQFVRENELYFKEGIIAEDLLWMFYVLKCLSVVSLVKNVTYHYYEREGSITTSAGEYIQGMSYRIIYDDILHHLTVGREDKELARYVEGFSFFYLKNKETIPEYKTLFSQYRVFSKKYQCWYARMLLTIVGFIGLCGNQSHLLSQMNVARQKVRKAFFHDNIL